MKYRHAFILFVLIYIIFFAPVIFRGEVIYPHNNDIEVGAPVKPDPAHISNGKFIDESNFFIPEINFILNSRYRAWLPTWNPDTEFGRPPLIRSLSRAYLISNVLSRFTRDPFLFYSITILITVFLSGLFMFLLMKSLDLHPLACLMASAGVSFSVFFTYWLTFNVFLSAPCWALGLMWLIRRFIQRPSYPLAFGLAYATYSLFMSAYPQSIILQFYLVAGFALFLLWKTEVTAKKKTLLGAALTGAAFFGVLMTAPAYMDVLEAARRAGRFNAGMDFLLSAMPNIGTFGEFLVYLNSMLDAFIFGNPIKENFVFSFNGLSLSPLYTALLLLTFVKGRWRRLWPWQAFLLFCIIGTAWPPAHIFAIRYLGFKLSATGFSGGVVIPAGILAGYTVDNMLRADNGGEGLKKAVVFLSLVPLALLYFIHGNQLSYLIDVRYLILNIIIIIVFYILSISSSRRLKTWGLLALTLLTVFVYGRSLRLIRPEANIHTTSDVVKFIKAETPGGTRLAFVGFKNLIPANQESLLGLRSIHTYDSLSSKEYQSLVKKLSAEGAKTYGKKFKYIIDGSRLKGPEVTYMGIGLYISKMELDNPGLVKIGQWRKYRFYKPLYPPVLEAQVLDYELKGRGAVLSGRLDVHRQLAVKRLDRFTDYKTYSLSPLPRQSLLFLSQQYHPRWRVKSRSGPLQTVMVNDFYEGVIIPPGTTEVILEFRPLILWMWVPQVLFILLGAVLAGRYIIVRRKRASLGPVPQGEYDG